VLDPLRIDLAQFLITWHGPPATPAGDLPPEAARLPEPLREWHRLIARWPEPFNRMNRMLAPGSVTPDEAGKATFLADPTGDWLWAFDTGSPPGLWERELYDTWQPVPESLPEFLAHHALFEAAYSLRPFRSHTELPAGRLPEVIAPMTEVRLGGWQWPRPGGRIFLADRLVAEVGPANRPHQLDLRVAGLDDADLAYLDSMAGVDWHRRSGPGV
jgi:hypothetical protein